MADVTLQPRPASPTDQPLAVAEGDYLPGFSGNWTAHLEFADQVPAPTGKVTLTWLGQALAGQVLRSGQSAAGRTFALVAGGNGHLGAALPPQLPAKAYRNSLVRVILQDILTAAGEQLSPAAQQDVLLRQVATWPRRQDTAASLLDDLARELGVIWRVQPDGTVWIGRYDFAEAVLSQELQQLDEADPAYAEGLFVPHAFGPLPGQSYQARKIGCAQYTISPDNAFVRLWYLDASTTDLDGGNLRRGLAELIKETLRLDWYGTYPGRVVTQRPDGTLDIALDSRTIPPLSAVRYRVFCPGARLSVAAGSRVEVRFDNADPMKPVADLFDPGEAQLGVARLNDPSRAGGLFATWINQVQAAINSLAPGSVTILPPNTDLVNISGVSEKVFLP